MPLLFFIFLTAINSRDVVIEACMVPKQKKIKKTLKIVKTNV